MIFLNLRRFGFYHWLLDRREDRLAARRPGMTDTELLDALEAAGADQDVAQWVIDWASPYYGEPTTPNAADRPTADLGLDSEELEDMAADFFKDHGLPIPSPQAPEELPFVEDTTWVDIATHFSRRRQALLAQEAGQA